MWARSGMPCANTADTEVPRLLSSATVIQLDGLQVIEMAGEPLWVSTWSLRAWSLLRGPSLRTADLFTGACLASQLERQSRLVVQIALDRSGAGEAEPRQHAYGSRVARKAIGEDPRFVLVVNAARKGAAHNHRWAMVLAAIPHAL